MSEQFDQNEETMTESGIEPEHRGSKWSHPYIAYIWLTVVLFLGLILAGYIGYQLGVIPNLD